MIWAILSRSSLSGRPRIKAMRAAMLSMCHVPVVSANWSGKAMQDHEKFELCDVLLCQLAEGEDLGCDGDDGSEAGLSAEGTAAPRAMAKGKGK